MFNRWLISDVEEAARKSDRIVISDPKHFLAFLVKELKDYAIITLNSPEEEISIHDSIVRSHEKLMTGGIWAIIDMEYNP